MNTHKKQEQQEAYVEVIFDGRNKSFGAYALRKKYNERLFIAFFVSTSLFILGAFSPQIKAYLFPVDIKDPIDIYFPQDTSIIITKIDVVIPQPKEGGTKKILPPMDVESNDNQDKEQLVDPKIVAHDDNQTTTTTDDTDNTTKNDDKDGDPNGDIDGKGGTGGGNSDTDGTENGSDNGDTSDEVITYSEDVPEFPGGENALRNYLKNNLNYPKLARDYNVTGRVIVEFIIEKDGSISSAVVKEKKGYGLDEEGIRVVKNMPKWKPGFYNKKPARFLYRLPIVFSLR